MLFPIDGELHAAAPAQHPAGAAAERHAIPARGADGVTVADLHRAGHVLRARNHGPFARRSIRHLQESADYGDWGPFDGYYCGGRCWISSQARSTPTLR